MKRLLHIFILTQVLILISGLGEVSSHVAGANNIYSPTIPQVVSRHIVAGDRSQATSHYSATRNDHHGHWFLSVISEVESENEEEQVHNGEHFTAASKYLLNLLLAADSDTANTDSDAIAFVSDNMANILSERIYLVLAVFRL